MLEKSFTINAALTVVAVNRAWEVYFGISRNQQIGKPCCLDNSQCRHKRVFDSLEPYAGLFSNEYAEQEESQLRVRGHPLLDEDGTLYIGESISIPAITKKKCAAVHMIGASLAFSNLKAEANGSRLTFHLLASFRSVFLI